MGAFTRRFISELLPFWLSRKPPQPAVKTGERSSNRAAKPAPLRPRPVAPFRPEPEPTDRRSSHLS